MHTPPPSVLVTDAGRGSALAIIRSLGSAGYRVIAADSQPGAPGLRSRHVSERLIYPDPMLDAEGFTSCLLEAVARRQVDLVIPVTDATLRALSARREDFEACTRLAMAEAGSLAIVNDKAKTLALARELGLPVSETRVVRTTEEALERGRELGWPVVLKPLSSTSLAQDGRLPGVQRFDVTYADSPEELAARMSGFEGRCPVLLQRYCEGEGVGVELLLAHGRPLAVFQHRRLREVPLTGGASALRESQAIDPRLFAWSIRLLEALDWTGLAMVEWKVGPRTELMEINGRVWGSLPLAVRSGVDFPAQLARLALEGEKDFDGPPVCAFQPGLRSRDLWLELLWIGTVLLQRRRHASLPLPRRREAFAAILQLFDPRIATDSFCWDDPRPGLSTIARLRPRLWSKIGRHRPPSPVTSGASALREGAL